MRLLSLAVPALAAALAGCSTYADPAQAERSASELRQALSGRVAGAPLSCLPRHRANDMVAIDENTILYRSGRTSYLTRMNGRCAGLGNAGYALVTRTFGSTDVCRGDIAHVVDTSSGSLIGSCSFGDFVPYTRP